MNKIVCDVCGTSYPDTSAQCPICGNAKSDTAVTTGNTGMPSAENYAYVKGGRFSHANVRKRNNGKTELPRTAAPAKPVREKSASNAFVQKREPQVTQYQEPVAESQPVRHEEAPLIAPRREQKKKKDNNIVLVVIVIVLVLAILAVCAYISVRLLNMNEPPVNIDNTTTTSRTEPTSSTSATPPAVVPCIGIRVSMPSYTFSSVGDKLLLEVIKQPVNTTDPVRFESSNPAIATVDAGGEVVAVANGSVTITVTCGEFTATCEITCRVGVDPTYTTVPPTSTTIPTAPTTRPTKPFIQLVLTSSDFTLEGHGSIHNLYDGELDPSSITWTSSDEKVATVENGIVTAVGNGTATITAEYEGQRVTCIVRCNKANKRGFTLSTLDTTIKVGDSFTLKAYDADGNQIDPSELKFYLDEGAVSYAEQTGTKFLSVDEKGVVTGLKSNIQWKDKYKIVIVEYNGETLKCIVRVKEA